MFFKKVIKYFNVNVWKYLLLLHLHFQDAKNLWIEENACSLSIIFPVTDEDSWSNSFIEFV